MALTGDDGQFSGRGTEAGCDLLAEVFKRITTNNKAIVSRVSFSPMLGVEVAGSIHHGTWDASQDEHDLTLLAIDGNLQRGAF